MRGREGREKERGEERAAREKFRDGRSRRLVILQCRWADGEEGEGGRGVVGCTRQWNQKNEVMAGDGQ